VKNEIDNESDGNSAGRRPPSFGGAYGKHGKAQLSLPNDQRVGLNVGSQFTLSLNGIGFVGAIDESVESTGPLGTTI
jgi:hypothetical protein